MSEVFKAKLLEISVAETGEARGFWLDKPWVLESDRGALIGAPLVAVPFVRSEDDGPVFPTGTAEFLDRLRDLLGDQADLGVAISDEAYQELALHSKAWRLPTLVVSAVVLPIVVNILSDKLGELLPGHKDGDTAEATFIIESPNHRALKVTYKGDPKEIGKFLSDVVPKYIDAIDGEPAQPALVAGKPQAAPKP